MGVTASSTGTALLIAGRIPLTDVMERLVLDRPVFHSEADFQHGFARALWELDPGIGSRLEVAQHAQGRVERLDLLCTGPGGRTAVEFKYPTRSWAGEAGSPAEEFALRNHAAPDLARRDYVFDMARLERFCNRPDQNGLSLLLTNNPSLWALPKPRTRPSRDHAFRIHQGCVLAGTLLWGQGDYQGNTRTLRGSYRLDWRPYSRQPGPGGEFRYLAAAITAPRN